MQILYKAPTVPYLGMRKSSGKPLISGTALRDAPFALQTMVMSLSLLKSLSHVVWPRIENM